MGIAGPQLAEEHDRDRFGAAISGGGRNDQGLELLCWSMPSEGLAWAAVELRGDGVQVFPGVAGEAGALGEVLAEQPAGVLVAAPLPRGVGVAEVDGDAGGDGELGVAGHLAALVPGQG